MHAGMTREVAIQGETIRLGQLLKLAGVIDSGSDAKLLLASEEVLVNGEREQRRGRQLRAGDTVRVGDVELAVVSS
jgi:ribosome-associated protein